MGYKMEPSEQNVPIDFANMKIKDLVNENFHTAELFAKFGIDFCCNGNRLIEAALKEKKISKSRFIEEYKKIDTARSAEDFHYSEWGLDFISKYIINNHHKYVKGAIPSITAHLQKIQNAHGDKYTFIKEIENTFARVAAEMTSHMKKEEKTLFPLIKYLVDSNRLKEKPKTRGYGSVQNPIKQMKAKHVSVGNAMKVIRTLTDDYSLPENYCATFQITYNELAQFEKDLHKHMHLENNILFARAIALEENLINGIFE